MNTQSALLPTVTAEVVFQAKDLTKTYLNGEIEVHALAGVDLELLAGELVVLLGRRSTTPA